MYEHTTTALKVFLMIQVCGLDSRNAHKNVGLSFRICLGL